MSLFLESNARTRAASQIRNFSKTAGTLLCEHIDKQNRQKTFDVFMSHAFDDKELVLGTTMLIEDMGYSVYLDWRDDPLLDRSRVTPETAAALKERMKASASLFYATTPNAPESKWMPWELGFKDGHNTRTAILPIVTNVTDTYAGQAYLAIYPYVSDGAEIGSKKNILWIHRTSTCYIEFDKWVDGKEPLQRNS